MWCAVYDEIRDHPKTRALSKALNCNRQETIGILVCLWIWGLSNADRDGCLHDAAAEDIADGIMSRGRSADSLVDSLVNTGWLDFVDGVYCLHDWDMWQETWYKAKDRKEADAERKRQERARKTIKNRGLSQGLSQGLSIGESATNLTVPNLTVPNLNVSNQTDIFTSDQADGFSDETKLRLIKTSREFGYELSPQLQQWADQHGV